MKKEKIIFIISLVMMLLATSISVYATSCLYNSSDVSYTAPTGSGLSANVQDSLTEVYGHCTDYTSMDTRVSSLEGHFQNNATSVFNGSMLNIKSSDSNSSRGLDIRDASDTARSYLYYSPSYDRVYLTSNNSSGTAGAGSLDIQGDPVTINGSEVMTKSVETFNITASRGKIEFAKGYKIGNIIIIRLWMSFTNVDLSNDTIIAYFPSQYYNGSTDIYFPVANAFSTSNNGCFGHIDADGNIKVRNCSNVGNHIMANVVYVLE